MSKMINYLFKKNLFFIVVVTVILLALAFFDTNYGMFTTIANGGINGNSRVLVPANCPIDKIIIPVCILATIIPVMQFRFKMNKISIDQMYSLPIKREKLYLSKYIIGLVCLLIPLVVIYLYWLICMLTFNHLFEIEYYLYYFPILIVFPSLLYTLFAFAFTRGNTVLDGIINMFFASYIFALITSVGDIIFDFSKNYSTEQYFAYSPFVMLSNLMAEKMMYESNLAVRPTWTLTEFTTSKITATVILSLLSVVSGVLFVILNKKEKAENTMQITESWFSYKTMIPINIVFFFILLFDSAEGIGVIYLLIVSFIGYTIYRRGLKIKKYDYIVMTGAILLGIIVCLIWTALNIK